MEFNSNVASWKTNLRIWGLQYDRWGWQVLQIYFFELVEEEEDGVRSSWGGRDDDSLLVSEGELVDNMGVMVAIVLGLSWYVCAAPIGSATNKGSVADWRKFMSSRQWSAYCSSHGCVLRSGKRDMSKLSVSGPCHSRSKPFPSKNGGEEYKS